MTAASVPGAKPGKVVAGDLRMEEPRHRASLEGAPEGIWHAHSDGFWGFVWDMRSLAWACPKCGVTLTVEAT